MSWPLHCRIKISEIHKIHHHVAPSDLTNLVHVNAQQSAELVQLIADMPDTDRAVMRGAALGPVVHKLLGADTEFVTAVGVADLQDRPSD